MTNLAPLFLSYIADEINVPRFTSEPRYLLNESLDGVAFESIWPIRVDRLSLASSFRTDLEPKRLDTFVERETPGVPRFEGGDVTAFLEGLPIHSDLRASTVWWEFHPLEDGTVPSSSFRTTRIPLRRSWWPPHRQVGASRSCCEGGGSGSSSPPA